MLAPRLLSARMRAQLKWSPGPGVKVLGITLQDEGNWVISAAAKPVGICPDCGARSQHRHSWHHRRLQDLPVQGQAVKIRLLPIEVFIDTGEKTFLEYLSRPILDSFNRAFTEE
ncbi:transposase family protein [Rhizobium sp. 32-5/1]|uniref:transposase family protein n=1 Tax=Rhizobium sp. 32-5/1 TaxID=3019602 RepID=UPI0032B85E33